MSPCTWLVQSSVKSLTLDCLQAACLENGNPLFQVNVVPRSDQIFDDIPVVNGPFVLYGYGTLMLNAAKSEFWKRGIFFDTELFRPSVYLEKWGSERFLNNDAKFLTMQEFAEQADSSLQYFIRPDDDLKSFTGEVMTGEEYKTWYQMVQAMGATLGGLGADTQIMICGPKKVGHEWRVFVVDGQIIGSACYSEQGREILLPIDILEFTQKTINDWSPSKAFVIDVTSTQASEPKIIEANCINGSSLYSLSPLTYVRALSALQESCWSS